MNGKKNFTMLKFAASSFGCYIVDYALYSLFVTFPLFFKGISVVRMANIAARIISSTVNFLINRRFVFKNKEKTLTKVIEYFALVAAVLVGSTLVLGFTVEHFEFNKYYTKIFVDIIFFAVNWFFQRFVIFKNS